MRICAKCSTPVFGSDRKTRIGYCKKHQYLRTDLDRRAPAQKAIAKVSKNIVSSVRGLLNDSENLKLIKSAQDLNKWFDERMKTELPVCENCGAVYDELKKPERKKQWRSCQAHLLPKRHFASIMTHPLNGMVLGSGYSSLCLCHDTYDSSWDKASKMKIWEEAVRRFKILYPLIREEEHRFIPNQLLQEVNQV